MRDSLGAWDGGDWFLVIMGGAGGLVWARISIVVGINWWSAAAVPWWEGALRAVLLWPLFAAFYAPLPGIDACVLTFAIGAATGLLGGLLLAWHLRR